MACDVVKLGDICSITKGKTGITKAIPGEYPMVALSEERKSHNEYQFDADAVIIPLVSSTGHGHASMKRIHFQSGKFALGTILCALVPKDSSEVSAEFLYHYLDMMKEILFVPLMKGVANVALPMKRIASVEIPLPSFPKQESIVEILKQHKAVYKTLDLESEKQRKLLAKYRQAILQEAIEGKLTEDWRRENPDVEPASELLKRIAAEKAELVKQKKIRKQKPLPKIKPDGFPFDVPESWEWCRLGDGTLVSESGKSMRCEKKPCDDKHWGIIKTSAITSCIFLEEENKLLPAHMDFDESNRINNGDLLFCRASGSKGLAGRSSIVRNLTKHLLLSDKSIRIIPSKSVLPEFIHLCNSSDIAYSYYGGLNTGKSTSMNNVTRPQLLSLPIPLPPLAEQQEIVRRVEAKFALCDQLEGKIAVSAQTIETLSAVILQELFEQKGDQ
jgi:type I restriction enzyme S subunit